MNFCGKYVNADGEIFNGTEPADYTANRSVVHYLAEAVDLVAQGFFSTHLRLRLHPSLDRLGVAGGNPRRPSR